MPDIVRLKPPFIRLAFLWKHRKHTGVDNDRILKNLFIASEMGARIRIRCILVNGVNTENAHYERVADIAVRIKNLDAVEFIPYHAYGGGKAVFIGREDNGKKEWIPTEQQISDAMNVMQRRGVKCVCNARKL